MSAPVFVLHVPTDPGFRPLATEVVGRYVDLAGGSEAERRAFETALTNAVDDMARHGDDIELSCVTHAPGFQVTLRCGSQSAVVRHPMPVEQR